MSFSSTENNEGEKLPPNKLQPVKFITEKAPSFRTYHADGAWGMLGNNGNIQINFFHERDTLPKEVTHEILQDGTFELNGVVVKDKDDTYYTVIREFDSAVILSVTAAENIHKMLGNFIKLSKDVANKAKPNE